MPPPPRSFLPAIFHTMATIEDLQKIEVRIGTVQSAQRVPNTDKLLRLMVDFGEEKPRQIISGIVAYVESPEELVDAQLAFVTNIEPRTICGYESNGMLFAVGREETFAFLKPSRLVPSGTGAN